MTEQPSATSSITTLLATGQQLLNTIEPTESACAALAERLRACPLAEYRTLDAAAGWLTCVLALRGVGAGNYGVGALLLDRDGTLLEAGHNETFSPHLRSEAHAEMVVLSAFEAQWPNRPKRQLSLYTSLESCPMCHVRALSAGLGEVVHVAADTPTGARALADALPAFWRERAETVRFREAEVGDDLKRLAQEIFLVNFEALARRLEALEQAGDLPRPIGDRHE